MPELASKGGYRAVVVDVDPVFDVSADDRGCVTAEFFLPKGCYVTVLLREYVKDWCDRGFALYDGVLRCLVLWFWLVCLPSKQGVADLRLGYQSLPRIEIR